MPSASMRKPFRTLFRYLGLLIIVLSLFGLVKTPSAQTVQQPNKAAWTIMFYICGDNNLEYSALMDVLEMEQGIPENVEVLVLLDRHKGYTDIFGNWTGTRLYRVKRGAPFPIEEAATGRPTNLPQDLASELLEDWGEIDMSQPENITRFITICANRFPAERYAFVPWNHGGGWLAMIQDEDGGGGKVGKGSMTMSEFARAVQLGAKNLPKGKFDLLKFEMCLMGQLDVLSDVQAYNLADYVFASAPVEPAQGSDYLRILPLFRSDIATHDLAQRMVDLNINYYTKLGRQASFSAYDLTQLPATIQALATLTKRLIPLTASKFKELTRATCFATHHEDLSEDLRRGQGSYSSVEIFDWLAKLENEVPGAPQAEIAALRSTLGKLIIKTASTPNFQECKGLTVYLPLRREFENKNYAGTNFGRASGLIAYLQTLYTAQDLLGQSQPKVTGIAMGHPKIIPGRSGQAGEDFTIEPISALRPFSQDVIRFQINGIGILTTKMLQFEERGGERFINCVQLVADFNKEQLEKNSGNILTSISPVYRDGTTTLIREITVKYKVGNAATLADITIENFMPNRNFFQNTSVGWGLYSDPTLGGQEVLVRVKFSNIAYVPLDAIAVQTDNQGRAVGMRNIILRQDGYFRPAVIKLGKNFKEERVFGPKISLNQGLFLTVDMLDVHTNVGYIIMAESMYGKTGIGIGPALPVRHLKAQDDLVQNTKKYGASNLFGSYAMIQYAQHGTSLDALPTFQVVTFASANIPRWFLKEDGKVKGKGILNWFALGLPQINLNYESKKTIVPIGETVQSWYAFLEGEGENRTWYTIAMGDGTRWALIPTGQYSEQLLQGVWANKKERFEFEGNKISYTKDGQTVTGTYKLSDHILTTTNMPAEKYALYFDKKAQTLSLMSRSQGPGVLTIVKRVGKAQEEIQPSIHPTHPTPATPQEIPTTPRPQTKSFVGSWQSLDVNGLELEIVAIPNTEYFNFKFSQNGQKYVLCTAALKDNDFFLTFKDGRHEQVRFMHRGSTLTFISSLLPALSYTRK